MAKISDTKSLRIVLERFSQTNEALSVVNLIEEFEGHMNRTTVYRILARLEDSGMLHSFTGGNGLKWYAQSQHSCGEEPKSIHPHFQCEKCGKTECLSIEVPIPNIPKHMIRTASYLMMGDCGKCDS